MKGIMVSIAKSKNVKIIAMEMEGVLMENANAQEGSSDRIVR